LASVARSPCATYAEVRNLEDFGVLEAHEVAELLHAAVREAAVRADAQFEYVQRQVKDGPEVLRYEALTRRCAAAAERSPTVKRRPSLRRGNHAALSGRAELLDARRRDAEAQANLRERHPGLAQNERRAGLRAVMDTGAEAMSQMLASPPTGKEDVYRVRRAGHLARRK
jgi:hypothetical protein